MKSKLLIITLLALNTGIANVHAEEEITAASEETTKGVGVLTTMTMDATVTAINQETREVSLRNTEGKEVTIQVGDEVKNLPQVEVGDTVRAEYYEAVTVRPMMPGSTPPMSDLASMETAKAGEKPAVVAAEQSSLVATVENIDKANSTVTLKGPLGNSKTVKARNPANLEKIAVGDHLLITYSTGVAMAVTKTPSAE